MAFHIVDSTIKNSGQAVQYFSLVLDATTMIILEYNRILLRLTKQILIMINLLFIVCEKELKVSVRQQN